MADGFLLVDKPGGMTSHDVVARARRLFGQRKIGHAGTLDPMATGLLVLGLGRATRLLRFVQEGEKAYVARACLGVATDTLDADGAILDREPMPVSAEDVAGAARRFVGDILQVPPMVSALKVDGRRLHDLAREGIEVEREARPVTIHEIRVLDFAPSDYPEVSLLVRCSTGTYVRTLADDIARALGGRAHLTALRRTAIGRLDVSEAWPLDDLAAAAEDGTLPGTVLSPAAGLAGMPAARVSGDTALAVTHGAAIASRALGAQPEGPVRLLDEDGALVAVYRVAGDVARAEVVLS
ncbi:MAG: tRNA pseudouridine(55) synthase TruB [Actinobacteria bacterium]|nr:tRNA pseudouridine(55) synthase TruB [Actinomycetota bacterium]